MLSEKEGSCADSCPGVLAVLAAEYLSAPVRRVSLLARRYLLLIHSLLHHDFRCD